MKSMHSSQVDSRGSTPQHNRVVKNGLASPCLAQKELKGRARTGKPRKL